jgi:DNA-binding CsgD family transcriptional regulator
MTNTCPHCGLIHATTCPRIKAIDYREDGSIKRIEFHPPCKPPPDSTPTEDQPSSASSALVTSSNGKVKMLSPTEVRMLEYLAMGDSNKVISRKMGNMEATVKVHMKSILRKLGCRNRTQVAALVASGGIHAEVKLNGEAT